MVFLVFSSAFFCCVFFGNGVLFAAMLGCSARKGLALRAFLGISFTALFFSIVQFFVPLSAFTLGFPTVAGMGGIFQFVR